MLGFTLSGKKLDPDATPGYDSAVMLVALQGRRIYDGSVSYRDKVARRRKNKMAKRARRINRG